MSIKKLLSLVFLFLIVFFEAKSSDGTRSSDQEIMAQIEEKLQALKEELGRKKTDLTLAAEQGSFALIKSLLEGNADINEKDEEGKTALMAAASRPGYDAASIERNRDTMSCLIGGHADVNNVDSEGKNALMLSLNVGGYGFDEEVFKLLISAKTDVTIKDCQGSTVLDYVAKKWLCSNAVFELLAHAYVGGSQVDQRKWAILIEAARRDCRQFYSRIGA